MVADMNIKGRSLLALQDLSDQEMLGVLDIADALKAKKRSGERGNLLAGKNVALLFEKLSTRTRCAAAVAAADEGAHTEYLTAADSHLGKKESVADTARVLGRMFDGIMFRGYRQDTVEQLARYSGVPVWNGLTDVSHPTQVLADLMTIRETFGRLKGLTLAYVGDGRNNVANSLMAGCAKCGVHYINCTPEALAPPPELVADAETVAQRNGSTIRVLHEPATAVKGVQIVYTDVWVSMGEASMFDERVRLLQPYQVNMELMEQTGGMGSEALMFLHCLPAFHNADTELTRQTGALEVTDDVFNASFSKVFDAAENRLHTIKAVMVASLGGHV